MAISSGIVLDLDTNLGVSGARVFVYTSSASLYSQGICTPVGTFNISIPDNQSSIVFVPMQIGYKGYSVCAPSYDPPMSLFMRKDSNQPNISGAGTLNFIDPILITSNNINDIKASPCNMYIATQEGLDILDINTFKNVGYISYSGGFNCITLNKNYCSNSNVLLGTSNSGVLEFIMSDVYDTYGENLTSLLKPKWSLNNGSLLSNKVTCIDQNLQNSYLVGTNSGIDYYSSSGIRYYSQYPIDLDTKVCRISEFDDLYYSPIGSGMYAKYATVTGNWIDPDYKVNLSGTGLYPFPLLTNYINDIKLTSISGNNSIFLATQSGLVYYNENRVDLNVSASGAYLVLEYP